MIDSDLQYEVLREINNLIELAANKGFAIGIGQKDTDHLSIAVFKQKRVILKLLGINI